MESSKLKEKKSNTSDLIIPAADPTYVPFGFYNDLFDIVQSKIFFTVYITGLSGNGKTIMVQQACAKAMRECIRVNITKRTDELDLYGGYELINGNTIRNEGPVLAAMRRGAILLLDEVDYGTEDLLCLQPVLEGKPYLDKKTNTVYEPAPGFNIIATANTKGKGTSDGRFVGANVLNEAFLERFAITEEQEYPNKQIEKEILELNFRELGLDINENSDFIQCLVNWSEGTRKTYQDGGISDLVSRRRLVHIANAYKIFNDKRKAIQKCLNRFDETTSKGLMDFYTKYDKEIDDKRKAEQLAKARAVRQNQNQNKTIPATSPDMLSVASKLSKRYATQVSIVKKKDKHNDDVLEIYSHGEKSEIDWKVATKLGISKLEDQLARMVEVNKANQDPD